RDGNTPAAFHAKCDNKGATIVIAKIKNSEQIVGGYNPLQWDSSGLWHSTFDSFIYFFADVKNIVTAKVSYSNGNKYSIGNNPSYAPLFGGGWDLYHDGNGVWYSNNNRNNSYPRIDDQNAKSRKYERMGLNTNILEIGFGDFRKVYHVKWKNSKDHSPMSIQKRFINQRRKDSPDENSDVYSIGVLL
ncbi:hypothetical protein RhiirC2_769178, partial [Rhizophagus irregularis]